MQKKIISEYDKKKMYNKEIKPIVEQLKAKSAMLGIPFFFSACVKNTQEESEYVNEGFLCGSGDIVLKDDRITPHLNIALGFRAVPPDESLELVLDEDPDAADMMEALYEKTKTAQ